MKILKFLYEYIIYTIFAVCMFRTFYIIDPNLELISDMKNCKLGDIIQISCIIICICFMSVAFISFSIKALISLILVFYYGLFYQNIYSNLQIRIDEQNRIKESYIEFKNGDILPVIISKIVTNNKINLEEDSNE